MLYFFLLIALIAGACMPTQAGVNAQLARWTRDPALAALFSFAGGTLTLLVVCLIRRTPLPEFASIGQTQPWHWVGGMLGALVVTSSVVLAPRIGAATLMALLITGQLLASVALDHYGLIGYEVRSINVPRLVGVLLLLAGVLLILRN